MGCGGCEAACSLGRSFSSRLLQWFYSSILSAKAGNLELHEEYFSILVASKYIAYIGVRHSNNSLQCGQLIKNFNNHCTIKT